MRDWAASGSALYRVDPVSKNAPGSVERFSRALMASSTIGTFWNSSMPIFRNPRDSTSAIRWGFSPQLERAAVRRARRHGCVL